MKPDTQFTDNIIKFEAITATPLKDAFRGLSLDHQLNLSEHILTEVKAYAANHGQPLSRDLWNQFKRESNWIELGKAALIEKSFRGRLKKFLTS